MRATQLFTSYCLLLSACGFATWTARLASAETPLIEASTTAATSPAGNISFELDIQPILTAAGCNAGACHGKQRGQNGFQLSLLGFDSEFDFGAIVTGGRGRRVFPAAPEDSLMLRKATGELPHGGGARFSRQSAAYQTLANWIAQGARRTIPGEPTLVSVALADKAFRLSTGQTTQLRLTAKYSDDTQRDVTDMATYLANDAAIAQVSPTGLITAGNLPGETAVMVRYMNHIEVAEVIIPYAGEGVVSSDAYAELPRTNFIDDLILKKLEIAATQPSETIDDATYLRRVTTDLIGRFPTVAEAREFLQTESPNKREYVVDRLLDSPEYADYWANQWADLLRPNPYRVGIKAVLNYDNWIREQFRQNVPYDEFARRLITAQGSTWRNGAVTLFRDRRTPDEMATLVSQLFLGIRLECAKCHHHPFENWSQEDFYQFSAFFARVDHKGTGLSPPISGGEETVFDAAKGEVRHPISGEVLAPEPLFGTLPQDAYTSLRKQLAEWVTARDNNYFAQVQVNRLWAALMGRGLVEPVDDLRSTNPPTNSDLLDALGQYFQEHAYDSKAVLKAIALSRTYALSSLPNDSNSSDRLNYSRHYRHRFRAEVLADSVAGITETPHDMTGMPAGSRTNQVWTHRVNSMFLDTFGRPDENQDPPCERTTDSTVTQALHLMNSRELDRRVRSDAGRAARLAASSLSSHEIAEELYLAIFTRFPTADESAYVMSLLDEHATTADIAQQQKQRRQTIEDLMWAMLNAPECVIQN
ncbi:MAG: DUF1549 and DUF1553 domain-containing protein [Pirellulaceae bacterium]